MTAYHICVGCMKERGPALKCEHCGWTEGREPESTLYLMPRTVLNDQYMVGRVLGHGGFGVLYLAWDLRLERKVAVKEYLPQGIAGRAPGTTEMSIYQNQDDYQWGLNRFLDEARVVARFHDRPDIVSVITYFAANNTGYMVMEFLDGQSLLHYVEAKGGRIPYDSALRLMTPAMDALREIHQAGILHRDISPDNIFVTTAGHVKLLDFGAARQALGEKSQNLSVILKEGYAPEEQYRSKGNQGPWTDIYATGATLYRVITGKVPPPAPDRVYHDEIEQPSKLGSDIPPHAETHLLRALAVRAEDRFPTMQEFQTALLSGAPAPPASPLPRPEPVPHSQPVPAPGPPDLLRTIPPRTWISGAAVLGVLCLLLLFWPRSGDEPNGNGGQTDNGTTNGSTNPPLPIEKGIVGVWKHHWNDIRGAHWCHIRYDIDGRYQWLEECPPIVQGDHGTVIMRDGKYNATSAVNGSGDEGTYELNGNSLRVISKSGIITMWEKVVGLTPSEGGGQPSSGGQSLPSGGGQPPSGGGRQPARREESPAQDSKTLANQIASLMRASRYADARPLLERLLKQKPNDAYANAMMGYIKLYVDNDLQAAGGHYLMAYTLGGSPLFRVKFGRGHETLANAPTGILAVSQQAVRLAEGSRNVFQQRRSAITDTRLSVPSQGGGGSTSGVRIDFSDRSAFVVLPTSQNPQEEVRLMLNFLMTSSTSRPSVRR